jgi:DNA-binding beta-propeller fold protein YncE
MPIPTRSHPLSSAIAVAIAALALFASPASADTLIGSQGSGAGQYSNVRDVAVDSSTGRLYVSDSGNNRIDVFDSSGAFLFAFGWNVNATSPEEKLQKCTTASGCQKGTSGAGPGQIAGQVAGEGIRIAVDSASHDVYVSESQSFRVQRFDSEGDFILAFGKGVNTGSSGNPDVCTAAGPPTDVCGAGSEGSAAGQFDELAGAGIGSGGAVYVADQSLIDNSCPFAGEGNFAKRVQVFSPAGALTAQIHTTDTTCGTHRGFAVDPGGEFYFANGGATGAVRRYDASGNPISGWGFSGKVDPSFSIQAIAVDSAGHLFVADSTGLVSGTSAIHEYDSAGLPVSTIYGVFSGALRGLAPTPTGLYVSHPSAVFQAPYPPPGPVILPLETKSSDVRSTKASLESRVNPEGKATTYHFEYVDEESYEEEGGFDSPKTLSTAETSLTIPPGGNAEKLFRAYPAGPQQVVGLAPETTYRFRTVAKDSEGNVTEGPEATFTTLEPLEFGETWATGVGTDSATLHGEANPLESATTGYFEYVDEASFEASGFAEAAKAPDVDGGAAPLDFGEGTALVERSTQAHPLKSGTTYRYRLIATDHCKADPEIVCTFEGPVHSIRTFAPADPLPTKCANKNFRKGPAAFLPDCRGYEMVSPLEKNGADVDVLGTISGFPAGLDQAATDGDSFTYSTYKAFGDIQSAPYTNQYIAHRDPQSGWQTEAISPKREGPSLMTDLSAQLDRQYKAFSPDLCQGWVVQDASPVLAPGGIEDFPGLYRREGCGPGLGSYEALSTVEPPNLPPEKFRPELQGASADGSVAIVSIADNLTEDAPAQPAECVSKAQGCLPRLYEAREGQLKLVCVLPSGLAAEGGCGAGMPESAPGERSSSLSHAISSDGSRIFWSRSSSGPGSLYVRIDGTETIEISASLAQFWAAASDGSKAIYTVGGNLFSFDVDTETPALIAEGVGGVAGASEDASRIYFTSTKALAGGASAGQANLYLYEEGDGFKFVATLPGAEAITGNPSPISTRPNRRLSRITPDGEQMAFMSRGSLTGYDNTDAVSKQADQEVFLYDATANGGAGELRCVSCNPSGARPVGRKLTQKLLETLWAAARIPTWQSQLHGSRVLSEDGQRLYFNSFEGLVSHDTNGQEDVYQWEAPGSGDCTAQSPSFLESSGGCLDLISSGGSPNGSELVDIGANGDDVFFKTSASLVPQDSGLIDVYDARVGGGFPPPEEPPGPCEGEACAPPAAAPNDPTPASAGFRGAGNPAPERRLRKACPKGKRKVRRAGKTRCVKQKRRQERKRHKQRSDRKTQ